MRKTEKKGRVALTGNGEYNTEREGGRENEKHH